LDDMCRNAWQAIFHETESSIPFTRGDLDTIGCRRTSPFC
jgi:hypothetical protein